MTRYHPNRVATVVTVAAAVGLAGQFNIGRAARLEDAADVLIRQIVAHTTRLGIGVRSTRELRAGTVSGKHQGWMEVETVVSLSGAFSWKVLDEGGSERTRNKVLRELLQAEAESWCAGVHDQSALTPANPDVTKNLGGLSL